MDRIRPRASSASTSPRRSPSISARIARPETRVLAATYHQVWWPGTSAVKFDGDKRPVWDEQTCTYVDPYTGEVLPTRGQALDAIAAEDEPVHVGAGTARGRRSLAQNGPSPASLNAMKAMTPTMMQSAAFATELPHSRAGVRLRPLK